MLGAPYDGREHRARRVVTGEAGLAHAGPVVHHQSLHILVRHDKKRVLLWEVSWKTECEDGRCESRAGVVSRKLYAGMFGSPEIGDEKFGSVFQVATSDIFLLVFCVLWGVVRVRVRGMLFSSAA